MRFLHTCDWHLGRTIRGRSRIDESARVLDDVVRIAADERVDAVLIAGDVFDTFGPPADAQKLLYQTLRRFVDNGAQVVMIAGNHDSAPRFDALAGILEIASVHVVGAPGDEQYAPVRLTSRDGERATIAAVPWIPERRAIEYDALFGAPNDAHASYGRSVERALEFYCRPFEAGTVNVLLAHVFVSNAVVGEGSGERKLQVGDLYAIAGQALPREAQYIALGHVHKPQPVPGSPVPGASYYAGSLLQLDFGEAEQNKSVRVVDVTPGLPADSREIFVSGYTQLRDLRITLDDLPQHEGRYADEYVRVFVEIPHAVPTLFDDVRAVIASAIDVIAVRTDVTPETVAATRSGLEPHELVARYHQEHRGTPISDELLAVFNALYEEELHASA